MDADRHGRIAEIFARARDLVGAERDSYLNETCADDPELRAEVESLLGHHAHADRAFPTDAVRREVAEPAVGLQPDDRIGPYRIERFLGSGGMGEIWLAQQTEPVRRQVALKVLKRGLDTKQVIARFEAERQALAVMDHPAIAKVHDAGETSQGLPYFAMEFVDGEPITAACDRQRLSTRARLELFLEVCAGVQHAHQKGIIHRDLKPTNVLVALRDGQPSPRIIDFGVAKATGVRLTERTMYTEQGVLIGTPEYMSPEQAELGGVDIDTRTDVYALGMLLYELLVGALPFDPDALRRAGFDEIRRRIREEVPSKPSVRVTTLGDAARSAAELRRTDPGALRRQLSGDLDWITMKALEKDRTRRYGSAAELAADLERHIRNEPVLAGPPSATYRVGKFVRRHRAGVAFTAALLVVVVGFAVTMTIQAGRIASERDRASDQADRASREAVAATTVSDFLVELFELADPTGTRASTVTARELLDRGSTRVDRELSGQPLVRARLMNTMGRVYQRLGLLDEAETLLEGGLKIREGALGGDHEDVAESLAALGWLRIDQSRWDQAHTLVDRALAIFRSRRDPDNAGTAWSLYLKCDILTRLDRFEEGVECLEEALALAENVHGRESRLVAWNLHNLGWIHAVAGNLDDGRRFYEEALGVKEQVLGPDHEDTARTAGNLAQMLIGMGRLEEAAPLLERACAILEKALGPGHPIHVAAYVNLGELYREMGRFEQSESHLLRAVSMWEANPSEGRHAPYEFLATLYVDTRRHGEAEKNFQRALAAGEGVFSRPRLAGVLEEYASLLHELDRDAEAGPLEERARALRQEPEDSRGR